MAFTTIVRAESAGCVFTLSLTVMMSSTVAMAILFITNNGSMSLEKKPDVK